jgi:integrase
MKRKLTEPTIRAAIRDRSADGIVDLADTSLIGLHLRIYRTGSASWVIVVRDQQGKLRRIKLGEYPSMGLEGAREAARLMRVNVRGGADPIKAAKAKRSSDPNATLSALVERYGEKKGKSKRSWPEARRCLEGVFKVHLSSPLASLTRRQLQDTADNHRAGGSASAAVRYLRPVLKWAIEKEDAPTELANIKEPVKVGKRRRVLSEKELASILPVLKATTNPYRRAMLFMLLTLARREEVCSATWQDIDLTKSVWTIPMTKNGREHEVPLPRQAVMLLNAIGPGDANELVFRTNRGSHLDNWDRETKRLLLGVGLAGVASKKVVMKDGSPIPTRHDLRRTGTTMLGKDGTQPHILEAALNHAVVHSQLAAIYNQSTYRPQVAEALQTLGDKLDRIAAPGAEDGTGGAAASSERGTDTSVGEIFEIASQTLIANEGTPTGLAEG